MRDGGLRGWFRAWMTVLIALGALVFSAAPAQAKWLRAETDRFVVYGQGREADLREFAIKLTTFDAMLRLLNPGALNRPPGHKLEVYLLTGRGVLARVRPGTDPYTRGFYATAPERVFAVVAVGGGVAAEYVLFHEYAHHFMLESFPAAYPAWFVEGWAEYYSTFQINRKGVRIGGYDENRAAWLLTAPWLPMEEVIGKSVWETRPERSSSYYAQAWLLMHYMRSTPERAAQLNRISLAIAAGEDPVQTFEATMGLSMAELGRTLRAYTRLTVLQFDNPLRAAPAIAVSALPPSADEFLLDDLRLTGADPAEPDAPFLENLRSRAARHAGDRFADLVLARAEFVWGDVAAAEAIMDRRLEADADDVEALRIAGWGQIQAGERRPEQREERFRKARAHLARAYQLDSKDYRILYGYAVSRTVEPVFPNDNDLNALLEARALAPQVDSLSLLTGQALLVRGRKAEAARVLGPLANSPHGGPMAAQASALLQGRSELEAAAAALAEAEAAPAH